jgi:catechol 2,3-dioxygenase-like lactoylglutathione lyase family enzyme
MATYRADRSPNPVVKVEGLAWLEFAKSDLDAAERFAHDFGLATAVATDELLWLRGMLPAGPCIKVTRGSPAAFLGLAFEVADRADLDRLAELHNAAVVEINEPGSGAMVELRDPTGTHVRVVADVDELPPLARQAPLAVNVEGQQRRVNATQRPPREPARVDRLGHVVLETTSFLRTLDWYMDNLGLIVSDYLYFPDQQDRGATMAFLRCDRGTTPTDHHTLALVLGPANHYVHSAFQVADLDALAAGSEFLHARGYRHSWGIGRHIQGSQIFDYWRDPDGHLVEHYCDGDVFDHTVEASWTEMSASGLAQWGPAPSRDFLGATPDLEMVRTLVATLRDTSNEFDLRRLVGLLKVATR